MNSLRAFVFALFVVAFAALSVVTAGCSRGPVLAPVEGKVILDGVTFKGGPRSYVVFVPDPKKGNESPHEPKSSIGEDGKYALMTVDKMGATPGWYKVRVEAAEVVDPANPYVNKWLIPERYANPNKSGLEIEVKAEGKAPEGAYDLSVKSK